MCRVYHYSILYYSTIMPSPAILEKETKRGLVNEIRSFITLIFLCRSELNPQNSNKASAYNMIKIQKLQ